MAVVSQPMQIYRVGAGRVVSSALFLALMLAAPALLVLGRALPAHGLGLVLRLAAATACVVLVPGGIFVRALGRPHTFGVAIAGIDLKGQTIINANVTTQDRVTNVNVNGTQNVLKLAYKHERRVVFASTSEVYGRNPKVPWRERSRRPSMASSRPSPRRTAATTATTSSARTRNSR